MNLDYIRAAIKAATGITLTIEQVKAYLVSEGLCNRSRADKATFRGYGVYYGDVYVEPVPDIKVLVMEEGVDIALPEDEDE